MTGFSSAEVLVGSLRVVWEVRSVNHRFLELGLRMPEELRSVEAECRELVGNALRRGKVDCTLKITAATQAGIPTRLVPEVLTALRALEEQVRHAFPDAEPLTAHEVLRWPGALEEPKQTAELLAEPVKRCLHAALRSLSEAREREGGRLAEMLERRNAAIQALIDGLRPELDGLAVRYRARLRERLEKLDVQAEPARLEQELALVAQRADVAEEVDRLGSHVAEIEGILRRQEPIGRRLDFVIQELNREANTFASKIQDETLTRTAVELKVLIEQMREQVQNLE